jgi:nucleotide-binding universal stress UspA family protein
MRRILCVIDFSESAAKVWDVAARIAAGCGADLIVLFPYRLIDYGHPGDPRSLKLKLEEEARQRFITLMEGTMGAKAIACEFHPEIGFVADRVSAHLKKSNIDMVVIGQQPAVEPKGFSVQSIISASRLPFVIVPTEVKAEVKV